MRRSHTSDPRRFGLLAILIGLALGGRAALDDAFDRKKPADDSYVDDRAAMERQVDFYNTYFTDKTHPPITLP